MLVPASSLMPAAAETWTWELPSWVLSRRRAVFAALEENQRGEEVGLFPRYLYVSFSNVTVALCGLFSASDSGVTERDVIFPLLCVSIEEDFDRCFLAYQKLKKSLTSFSLVLWAMFFT